MNRMDFWAGMALAGMLSNNGVLNASRAWDCAEEMEKRREKIKDIVEAAEEPTTQGTALTNEAVAQLVADLARDGRRYFSTINALEDALSNSVRE